MVPAEAGEVAFELSGPVRRIPGSGATEHAWVVVADPLSAVRQTRLHRSAPLKSPLNLVRLFSLLTW